MPVESQPDMPFSIIVKRDSSTGDVEVVLTVPDTQSDRYRLLVDGRVADTGTIPAGSDKTITLAGKESLRLARALAKGKNAILKDAAGKELGRVSLDGSRKALAHIDQVQNRASTMGGLAVIGRKQLRAKSAPPPIIAARRIKPVDATPDAAALVALAENSICQGERFTVTEDSAYSLGIVDGKARALVLISCGSGAYNFASAIFTATQNAGKKWDFMPATMDFVPNDTTESGGVPILINAGWDPATQTLESFSKARGLGDCGRALSYVWDGAMFRLSSAIGMEECRGSLDWMPLWHAEVRLTE